MNWPKELAANDTSAENINAASGWAKKRGADLMCVALPGVSASKRDSKLTYTLLGIDLQLWEIDPFDAKNINEFVEKGELPERRKLSQPYLLHFNAKADKKLSTIGSSFLYLTKDEGMGVITITDHVTEARDITGAFSAPNGVGFHRGVRFDFKHIAR